VSLAARGESVGVAAGRHRLASPRTATGLALLVVVLLIAAVPLLLPTRHLEGVAFMAVIPVFVLAFAAVGVVVARRAPRNPVGWLLLGIALSLVVLGDARVYAVLDYRLRGGRLPLGPVAVLLAGSISELLFLLLPVAILLFPDGSLSRPWRSVLRVYLALAVLYETAAFAGESAQIFGHRIEVDTKGQFVAPERLTGVPGLLAGAEGVLAFFFIVLFLGFWLAFVGRQVVGYRRASSERRSQLKWLMSGGVLSVAGIVVLSVASGANGSPSLSRQAVEVASVLMIVALPVSIGVGILKYRLYEIDRIISRTLVYGALTAVLGAAYVGLVLAGQALFSSFAGGSNLAIAISTLVVAALFLPVRARVQAFVDRRFYRRRYDAQRTLERFGARLREQVDLDALRGGLIEVVDEAMQPEHVSLWLRREVAR